MKPPENLDRALSIRQPYLEAILRGTKAAEHRSRPTRVRERVYLYAALKLGDLEEGARLGISAQAAPLLPRGVIVGSVELVDCRQLGPDEYAWVLAHATRYRTPLQALGHPQPSFWCPRWR